MKLSEKLETGTLEKTGTKNSKFSITGTFTGTGTLNPEKTGTFPETGTRNRKYRSWLCKYMIRPAPWNNSYITSDSLSMFLQISIQ